MVWDPAFGDDCPYAPGGMLIDDVVEVDVANSRVVARMPTHDDLPLTREQRAHPTRHPRHVSGGLMVHMTGMVGFVHAYYVLGLRHNEGWIGYGGRIHSARFVSMGVPGIPMLLECKATQVRKSATKVLARYDFNFTQEGNVVYRGDQTALWMKVA